VIGGCGDDFWENLRSTADGCPGVVRKKNAWLMDRWRIGCSRCAGPLGQQRGNPDQVADPAPRTQGWERIEELGELSCRTGDGCAQSRVSGPPRASGLVELLGAVGTEQPVGTDFDEAARQDVKEESADELLSAQLDALELLAAVVPVSESHPALAEVFDPAVGDGNAKHVARQIVQDLLSLAGVLAMHDPVLLPHRGGNLSEQTEFSEAARNLRERFY